MKPQVQLPIYRKGRRQRYMLNYTLSNQKIQTTKIRRQATQFLQQIICRGKKNVKEMEGPID